MGSTCTVHLPPQVDALDMQGAAPTSRVLTQAPEVLRRGAMLGTTAGTLNCRGGPNCSRCTASTYMCVPEHDTCRAKHMLTCPSRGLSTADTKCPKSFKAAR